MVIEEPTPESPPNIKTFPFCQKTNKYNQNSIDNQSPSDDDPDPVPKPSCRILHKKDSESNAIDCGFDLCLDHNCIYNKQ